MIKLARKCVYCKQGVGEVGDGVGREGIVQDEHLTPHVPPPPPFAKKIKKSIKTTKKQQQPKTRESVSERNIVKMDGCF